MIISFGFLSFGQNERTQELPVFHIRFHQFRKFSSHHSWQTDSATLKRYRTQNLGQLLQEETSIFIKNYGPGTLATSSLRGGSAQHTATLWNGFQISSPMLGQLDFSLLPVAAFQQVDVQFGESSALWGSGAVAGSIHLNNTPHFQQGNRLQFSTSGGSFHTQSQQIQFHHSDSTYAIDVHVYRNFGKNDFRFFNPHAQRNERMEHAKSHVIGAMLNQSIKLSANSILSLRYWWQQAERQIPPTLMESQSSATQVDQFHRLIADFSFQKKRIVNVSRVGFFAEGLRYQQSALHHPSNNEIKNIIAESDFKIDLHSKIQWQFGAHTTNSWVESDGYDSRKSQHRLALFSGLHVTPVQFWTHHFFVRKELVDKKQMPLTYSYGSKLALSKWLNFKWNAAYIYRIPTLNDLYWNPGGNTDLRPEKGFSGDFSTQFNLIQSKQTHWQFNFTAFHRQLNDWILWLPEQNYWTPQNLMQVWSRGIEIQHLIKWKSGNWSGKINQSMTYVKSTNQRAKMENDASVGKQLIYTPVWQSNFGCSIKWKNWEAWWQQIFIGQRFISTDNHQALPSLTYSNLRLSYNTTMKSVPVDCFVQFNNLFNTHYQIMAMRPMPLFNLQVGGHVSLQFNKNK
jgi:vitamin B12 transporter